MASEKKTPAPAPPIIMCQELDYFYLNCNLRHPGYVFDILCNLTQILRINEGDSLRLGGVVVKYAKSLDALPLPMQCNVETKK